MQSINCIFYSIYNSDIKCRIIIILFFYDVIIILHFNILARGNFTRIISYYCIRNNDYGEEVKCVAIISDYRYDNENGAFGKLRAANADNKEDVYSDLLIYNCNDWEVKLYYKDNLDDRPKTSDFNISLPKEWKLIWETKNR